jgi:hypothetical protein
MKLYSFFFQYKELTHVNQFRANSLEESLKLWSNKIQTERIEGADNYFCKTISEEVDDRLAKQGLTARDNLKNVWCCTFVFEDGAFGDLNITITDEVW